MAITQAFCTSAKVGFLTGTYAPTTDTMKIALYTSGATLNASTTTYVPTTGEGVYEVVGTGYTIGGNTLTGAAISYSGTTAWLTFSNTSWTTATLTARGALIYDFSKSNAAIAVLDFGSDKTSTAGTFTIEMPAAAAGSALIRIA
jgi:hypothetical protein